jgi:hypothetical protein
MNNDKNVCNKKMNYNECELAILRMQVDKAQEKMSRRVVNSPEIKEMFKIVEQFIKKKNLVCYGGISINSLLPSEDKIYHEEIDLPDYDMFSPNALEDAKELADIYYQNGYTEVEARSGQHYGTSKVFVNFIGVADITEINRELFNVIKKKAIRVNGILYTDPNFLRMSMYLELSRPSGDTSRWEKVLKRLLLINKYYPLNDFKCNEKDFQRKMVDDQNADKIFEITKDTFIHEDCVFFGGYAISEYSQYMPNNLRKKVEKYADFDVLARDPKTTSEIVKERLKDAGVKNIKIIKRDPIGEVIPLHYEIIVGKDTIAFVYKPIACHSYNVLMVHGKKVKIATIDTMLSFYFAFLYANKSYYDHERILCMAKFLFDVQQKNRLEQKGLLKRFSIICYGHQESVEEMRAEKAKKFKELKDKRGDKEYEEWFLNYRPSEKKLIIKENKNLENRHDTKKKYHNKSFNFHTLKNRHGIKKKFNDTKKKYHNKSKSFNFRTWKNKSYTKNEIY